MLHSRHGRAEAPLNYSYGEPSVTLLQGEVAHAYLSVHAWCWQRFIHTSH